MKDNAPSPQRSLPCSFRTLCLLWLDYLELSESLPLQSLLDLTPQELQQVQKVQHHLFQCPSCPSFVRSERQRRSRQRSALQTFLQESEQQVPSTVARTLAALNHEIATSTPVSEFKEPGLLLLEHPARSREQNVSKTHHRFRSTFALVAALVLILTGLGIFHQFSPRPHLPLATSAQPALSATPPKARVLLNTWSSLVLTRPSSDGKTLLIENYDPREKHAVLLLPKCCPLDTVVDGVSHTGDDLLYHHAVQNHTTYSLLSGPGFTIDGQGGNALWSTDDHTIYTFANQHLFQYDFHRRQLHQLAFSLPATITRLQFYYQNYLYFSSSPNNLTNDLYRINLITGLSQFLVESFSSPSESTSFWLSPSGTRIYYVDTAAQTSAIFSLALDGSNRYLVTKNAVPVGYAANNTLIVLRESQGKFQLVMLTTPNQVLIPDLAPGSIKLSAYALALAPYAGSVVAAGAPADTSLQFWFTDVSTGLQHLFLQLSPSQQKEHVHLIGWDRLLVPG